MTGLNQRSEVGEVGRHEVVVVQIAAIRSSPWRERRRCPSELRLVVARVFLHPGIGKTVHTLADLQAGGVVVVPVPCDPRPPMTGLGFSVHVSLEVK